MSQAGRRPLWCGRTNRSGRDDVRRGAKQHFALHERLAHEAELVIFEIAQAAVDELGRGRGGGAGEVDFLAEIDGKPAPGRVARDAAAVDATADDGNVEGRSAHLRLPFCGAAFYLRCEP